MSEYQKKIQVPQFVLATACDNEACEVEFIGSDVPDGWVQVGSAKFSPKREFMHFCPKCWAQVTLPGGAVLDG